MRGTKGGGIVDCSISFVKKLALLSSLVDRMNFRPELIVEPQVL